MDRQTKVSDQIGKEIDAAAIMLRIVGESPIYITCKQTPDIAYLFALFFCAVIERRGIPWPITGKMIPIPDRIESVAEEKELMAHALTAFSMALTRMSENCSKCIEDGKRGAPCLLKPEILMTVQGIINY